MKLITYNGANAYLVDDAPDWGGPLHVEWSLLRSDEAGLSRRETRRALFGTAPAMGGVCGELLGMLEELCARLWGDPARD